MSIVSKKISETRIAKGLTQEELAEKSQVNLRTIQRIESNESEPRGKTLTLICQTLEINIKDLAIPDGSNKKSMGIAKLLADGFFLVSLNMILMGIIGFLTLDSNANVNSRFGGFLVSLFLPVFIVFFTKNMSGLERMLKFGFGYILYFILVMITQNFPVGFFTCLFPCLLISLSVLYFGDEFFKHKKNNVAG